MIYSKEDRLNIFMSIAFEGAARTALQFEARNGGIFEAFERAKKGDADYAGSLGADKRRHIEKCASESYLDDFIACLEKDGVIAAARSSPIYPWRLQNIPDPPYVLYARGAAALKVMDIPVSVVGTRHCTDYGRTVSDMMGTALAESGATVVSGLAYGCDSFAHEGALKVTDNPFPTAAVLGHGVLVNKGDNTQKTLEKILERGAIFSEYLPRTKATQYTFPMRNRIISGISGALLVVEAGKKSGTMITAGCALEQGRDVYAVPCRITEPFNSGTNDMLAKGWAQPAYSAEDLMLLLGLKRVGEKETAGTNEKKAPSVRLEGEQKTLFELLKTGEKSFDELLEKTGISVEKLNLHLTELEFSGLIKQLPGRVYSAE